MTAEKQIHRETGKETNKETDKQNNGQIDKTTYRQNIYKQIDSHTDSNLIEKYKNAQAADSQTNRQKRRQPIERQIEL